MKSLVLLTGATGFLGRAVMDELLARGFDVATLIRSDTKSAQWKFVQILPNHPHKKNEPLIRLIEGDITRPLCGLGTGERHWLKDYCGAIVHCAADVSFRDDAPVLNTNFRGTEILLDLACQADIEHFHYVSTAFVCADRTGLIREQDEVPAFARGRNGYEQSKILAEQAVRSSKLKWSIYRPSIIVGDSVTGYTTSFNSFYTLVRFASMISKMPAMFMDGIKLGLTGDEPVNMVNVDWVADVIGTGVQEAAEDTFHITAVPTLTTREVYEVLAEYFNLGTVTFVGPENFKETRIHEAFNEYLGQYRPYWGSDIRFDTKNTNELMKNTKCRIDKENLRRIINFAVQNKFSAAKLKRAS